MEKNGNIDGYRRLANAIVNNACEEWLSSKMAIFCKKGTGEEEATIRRVENFFGSDWYYVLCDMDHRTLMRKLNRILERNKALIWWLEGNRVPLYCYQEKYKEKINVDDEMDVLDYIMKPVYGIPVEYRKKAKYKRKALLKERERGTVHE